MTARILSCERTLCTYNSLPHALRRAFPQYVVKQQNYVIGIQGCIKKQQWRKQLTELRMDSHQQDKTIQKCIAASIRGTHAVAISSKVTMVDRGGHETQGHTVEMSIYIYILFIVCYIPHM